MVESQEYLLGMTPAEVRRLEEQHAVWRSLTSHVWDQAGFAVGQTLVDLGSGPGFTSLDLAGRVGKSGRVIAVDSSRTATDQLRMTIRDKCIDNVKVVTADASDFDPSPWNPDGVFARWLFCFLRDPELILERLISGLRTGAVIAIMDYWNYRAIRTEPDSPLFNNIFRCVYRSFADSGGSLDVAGRLPGLFEAFGCDVTHLEPLCQIGPPGSMPWRWVSAFQQVYLPTLVQKRYFTETMLEEYLAWWRDREADKGALLFAPPLLGVIAIKR